VCFPHFEKKIKVGLYDLHAVCVSMNHPSLITKQDKLRGLSPRANYTDRATAACQRSYCQPLRMEVCRVVNAADRLRP
jgi:hypothetical protein